MGRGESGFKWVKKMQILLKLGSRQGDSIANRTQEGDGN
jgi:hypothetical protein